MNDTVFRILAVIIFLIGASISGYFRRKADRESGEQVSLKEEGNAMLIALRLTGISIWLSVFAYMLNPNWMSWSRIDLPDGLRWLGVAMGLLGNALAYWVFSNLRNNVSPTVVTRSQATLVTSGPYRWVRHPLYLMGLISYTGFALLAENWFIALLSLAVFGLLVIRTAKEEAKLVEKFGAAYRNYMQHTGRFFPKLG
jgi:protein-S-isoprenylcysteine O-methyltransferase Ste14